VVDAAAHFLVDREGRIYEGRWARDYLEALAG